ncbi:hypothetical protein BCV70DRAFT_3437 [Testicularia cyperi]|uniref:Uncharacterized protein n=1 Tax=Testicularia cyperi TaxID=1882483 RepID=A0A317XWI9_9BASI|nr:hypothetical protein BCV70DRAFT_3437 [Testicularia cyperi]
MHAVSSQQSWPLSCVGSKRRNVQHGWRLCSTAASPSEHLRSWYHTMSLSGPASTAMETSGLPPIHLFVTTAQHLSCASLYMLHRQSLYIRPRSVLNIEEWGSPRCINSSRAQTRPTAKARMSRKLSSTTATAKLTETRPECNSTTDCTRAQGSYQHPIFDTEWPDGRLHAMARQLQGSESREHTAGV